MGPGTEDGTTARDHPGPEAVRRALLAYTLRWCAGGAVVTILLIAGERLL